MMPEKKTTEFLDVLSSKEPVPGGGGASATVGAFAGALGMMVANLTIGKKKYAGVEEEIKESLEHLRGLQKELIRLTDADAEAFRAPCQSLWPSKGDARAKSSQGGGHGDSSL